MIILSIDFGKARTGIAISDKNEFLATPVCTIKETNFKKLIFKIFNIIKEQKVEKIVIGLPKNMNDTEGESARLSRKLSVELKKIAKLDVVMQDERCTTITAHQYLNNTNVRGKKRKEIIDTVSAVIILQDYLDSKKNKL